MPDTLMPICQPGENTLTPANTATRKALSPYDDSRVLVRLDDPSGLSSDTWTRTTDALTGRAVFVRRTACGGGCRCAAEVKLAPVKVPARITFPTEQAQAIWAREHGRRLQATYSRPELHAIWDEACLGMKTEGHRARKAELAEDIGRHDARLLGEEWYEGMSRPEEYDQAEARIRKAGTPTMWAGTVPDPDGACPADPSGRGEHGWRGTEAACRFCGADMSAAVEEWLASPERAQYARIVEGMREAQERKDAARASA